MSNLAYQLRPKTLSDVLGQDHLLAPDKIIYRMIKAKRLSSMIFYAPPGSGKNSLAQVLANELNLAFHEFNASMDDKKKLQGFANLVLKNNTPIVIFIDEIHRLDKTKQDYLLQYMENGLFVIIGATTENPYITINPALRSRSHIFELKPLNPNDLVTLIEKGIRFLIKTNPDLAPINVETEAISLLATRINGDARACLNTLELAVLSSPNKPITAEIIAECLGQKHIAGDKNGDEHYNLLSAFQKSIRGSDVDASLHYLAKLVTIGDLVSIMRRLSIIAFEDIGLAAPSAINLAMNAIDTAAKTGLPEARIPLAVATCYLALAPKSNIAYKALDSAIADLKNGPTSVPHHLRDSHFKGAKALGHIGYLYPHDYPNHWIKQNYLPNNLTKASYFKSETIETDQIEKLLRRYNYFKEKSKTKF